MPAFSATVTFNMTNSLGQPDTNRIKLVPVNAFANVDGSYSTRGIPFNIQPNTNGYVATTLAAGTYLATNAFLVANFNIPGSSGTSQGVLFNVDSSTNTYSFTRYLRSGYNIYNWLTNGVTGIIGTNGFQVITNGDGTVTLDGSQFTATVYSITNGLGFMPPTFTQVTNIATNTIYGATNTVFGWLGTAAFSNVSAFYLSSNPSNFVTQSITNALNTFARTNAENIIIVSNAQLATAANLLSLSNGFTTVSNSFTISSNGLAGVSNRLNSISNNLTVVSNGLNVVSNGLTITSNGLASVSNLLTTTITGVGVISNGLTSVSNGFITLSNRFTILSNGFGTVSNSFTTLSNGFGIVSNGFTGVSNKLNSISNNLVTVSNSVNEKVDKNNGNATNISLQGTVTIDEDAFITSFAWGGNRVLVTDSDAHMVESSISDSELNGLSGITANIQTQLNNKLNTSNALATNSFRVKGNLTVDTNANISSNLFVGGSITATNLTASRLLVSDANQKITNALASTTEANYLVGVTGGIQTNIVARVANSNGFATNLTLYGDSIFGANATLTAPATFLFEGATASVQWNLKETPDANTVAHHSITNTFSTNINSRLVASNGFATNLLTVLGNLSIQSNAFFNSVTVTNLQTNQALIYAQDGARIQSDVSGKMIFTNSSVASVYFDSARTNSTIGTLTFRGNDTLSNRTSYASISAIITEGADGSEAGGIDIFTRGSDASVSIRSNATYFARGISFTNSFTSGETNLTTLGNGDNDISPGDFYVAYISTNSGTPSASFNLNSIAGAWAGKQHWIVNGSGYQMTVKHESLAAGIETNRLRVFGVGADLVTPTNGVLWCYYSTNLSRWIVASVGNQTNVVTDTYNGNLATNGYSLIAIPGKSSTTNWLRTLVAGSNITLTTNATNITIASSGGGGGVSFGNQFVSSGGVTNIKSGAPLTNIVHWETLTHTNADASGVVVNYNGDANASPALRWNFDGVTKFEIDPTVDDFTVLDSHGNSGISLNQNGVTTVSNITATGGLNSTFGKFTLGVTNGAGTFLNGLTNNGAFTNNGTINTIGLTVSGGLTNTAGTLLTGLTNNGDYNGNGNSVTGITSLVTTTNTDGLISMTGTNGSTFKIRATSAPATNTLNIEWNGTNGIYSTGNSIGFVSSTNIAGFFTNNSTTAGVSNQLAIPIGSSAFPGLGFIGDHDTGIKSPNANQIDLIAGGVVAAHATSSSMLLSGTLAVAGNATPVFTTVSSGNRFIFGGITASVNGTIEGANSGGNNNVVGGSLTNLAGRGTGNTNAGLWIVATSLTNASGSSVQTSQTNVIEIGRSNLGSGVGTMTNRSMVNRLTNNFVMGTRYTNTAVGGFDNRRAWISQSCSLVGGGGLVGKVTLTVEGLDGITMNIPVSVTGVAATSVQQASAFIGNGDIFYFTDGSSGGGTATLVDGASMWVGQ